MKRRIVPILMAVLVALLFWPPVIGAYGLGDYAQPRMELTVVLERADTPLPDARFNVYHVGELGESGAIVLDEEYAGEFTVTDIHDQRGWARTAREMAEFVVEKGLKPVMSGVTGADGRVSFGEADGLSRGVFFVVGDDVAYGDKVYSSLPYLVSVPGLDPETGEWVYELITMPKPGEKTPDPAPTPSGGGGKKSSPSLWPGGRSPKTGDILLMLSPLFGAAIIILTLGYRMRRRDGEADG